MRKASAVRCAAPGRVAAGGMLLCSLLLRAGNGSAQQPGINWVFETGAPIMSSPALGADGTIYIGTGTVSGSGAGVPGAFYSISPSGSTNWVFRPLATAMGSPAVGADGTIYFPCDLGKIYAFSPAGTTNWWFQTSGRFLSSPAIGADGTIYVCSISNLFNKLYALRPEGTLKWVFRMGAVPLPAGMPESVQRSCPAIGRDGTIYVGSLDAHLYAISPSGATNWTATLGAQTFASPSIGPDGTIYIGADDYAVYAFDWLGRRKWTYSTGSWVESSAALSAVGDTIFVGSLDKTMNAVTPAGARRWVVTAGGEISSTPAVAADGSIYFGTVVTSQIMAVSSNGVVRWTYPLSDNVFSSPVIGPDGMLYVGAGTKVYAFYRTNSLTSGSWPMFRRDPRHHARSVQRRLDPPQLLPDGNVVISLSVETGRTYQLQQSTNLLDWTEWISFFSSSVSTQFLDLTATNSAQRSYRLWTP